MLDHQTHNIVFTLSKASTESPNKASESNKLLVQQTQEHTTCTGHKDIALIKLVQTETFQNKAFFEGALPVNG